MQRARRIAIQIALSVLLIGAVLWQTSPSKLADAATALSLP
jgi:energy-coupling factor transporter transmembrane protein EcfT